MRLLPRSIRTRLTLWYTTFLAVPLVAFAVVSYLLYSTALYGRIDAFLDDALTVLSREMEAERRNIANVEGAVAVTMSEMRFQDLDFVVLDAAGNLVAKSPPHLPTTVDDIGPTFDAETVVTDLIGRDALNTGIETVEGPLGLYRRRVRSLELGGRTFWSVGIYPLGPIEDTLRSIRRLFLILIPLLIAAAAISGFFLARKSMAPVSTIAQRASEIGASNLHDRVPVEADDELGALAGVLNTLLDRLESSFSHQRRFMADASHELRTPTAIIRTEADVTLAVAERSADEYRASLGIVQDASRRITRIVDDIFLLARADAGHLVLHEGPVYLEEIVENTVRSMRPIADSRDVRIELDSASEAPLVGDPDLLGRLVLNLLDNAVKHSHEGGSVRVALNRCGPFYEISVSDAGPGIPEAARDRIFERFFRLDSTRSYDESTFTSGAGLGLSICRRIAELHHGRVLLAHSEPGHTEFRALLPVPREA